MPPFVEIKFAAVEIVRDARLPLQTLEPAVFGTVYLARGRPPVTTRVGDGPAGKAFGDLDDVLLRITAIDAERMELHQFAGVIFVDPASLALLSRLRVVPHFPEPLIKLGVGKAELLFHPLAGLRRQLAARPDQLLQPLGILVVARRRCVWRHRFEIVQVEEHRRMLSRPDQQILEITQGVLSQDVPLIARDVPANRRLSGKNVKVILPKIDHHLLQLFFRINGTQYAVSGNLRHDLIGRL